MRRMAPLWLGILGVAILSVAFVTVRLRGLPELPVTLGPRLVVRAVSERSPSGAQKFQRGDRLRAVRGKKVEEVRDLRILLRDVKPKLPPRVKPKGPVIPTVSYQIVRPRYRFNRLYHDKDKNRDPAALPPGVKQGDLLVELDGRPLPQPVGVESIRSILASRPEALLGLERREAVFSGRMRVPQTDRSRVIIFCFAIAIALLLALWWGAHRSLARSTSLAVAAETVCFAWIGVLVTQYQWIIADYALASAAALALLLMRPLGIYARTVSNGDGQRGGWGAVVTGALCGLVVTVLLQQEIFLSAELALRFAALVAGLFVVFEVVLTGMNEGGGVKLGERSFYLAGVVLLMMFACFVAWQIDPIAFKEVRWRWFLAIVLALMWFGDVILAFRGLPASPLIELSSVERRLGAIEGFLGETAASMHGVDMQLMVLRDGRAVVCARGEEGLLLEEPPEELQAAMEILIDEGARVPVPVTEKDTNPMAGIADSMHLALALHLPTPPQTLDVEGAAVVLFGVFSEEAAEDGIRPAFEEIEALQEMMDAGTWSALLVEALAFWAEHAATAPARAEDDDEDDEDRDRAEERGPDVALLAELEAVRAELGEVREAAVLAEARATALLRWYRPLDPAPRGYEQLLEPELLEAIDFLYEDFDPIAIAGAFGTGKAFVARCAHERDPHVRGGPCVVYDAAQHAPAAQAVHLLLEADAMHILRESGEHARDLEHDTRPPLFQVSAGGTLVIRHAEALEYDHLARLVEEAPLHPTRVVLCFTDPGAESRSVFEHAGPALQARMMERELVLPALRTRHDIKDALFEFLLIEAAHAHMRDMEGFSPSALNALFKYAFPGNIAEAKVMLDIAVARAPDTLVEIADLPADVRR